MPNPKATSKATEVESAREGSPRKGRGLWWKVPVGLLLVVVLVAGLLLSQLSGILTWAANGQLPGLLGTECSIERVEIRLLQGKARLQSLRIGQPEGFGEDALLELDRFALAVDLGSLLARDPITVELLEVEGLRVHVIRDTNGVFNVQRLAPPPKAEAVGDATASGPSEGADASPVAVILRSLAIRDLAVTYDDGALVEEHLTSFTVSDLALSLKQLRLFTAESEPPSPLQLSLLLDQGEHPSAKLGLLASVGSIGSDVPEVNAQIKLTGFMLDTLGALVPTGVRTAVGGSGLDMKIRLALTAAAVDLQGRAQTDQEHGYPVGIHGSLTSPDVNLGPIAAALAMRFGGSAVNLTKNLAGAATDLGKGATEGVAEISKGATKAVSLIGGGLLHTSKGVLTGHLDEAAEGLKEASVGSLDEVAEGAKGTAHKVSESAKDSVESSTGENRNEAWLAAIESRHAADMETAREALQAMAWPPVIDLEVPTADSMDGSDSKAEPEAQN